MDIVSSNGHVTWTNKKVYEYFTLTPEQIRLVEDTVVKGYEEQTEQIIGVQVSCCIFNKQG